MAKDNDWVSIGQVYGGMLNTVRKQIVTEAKAGPKKGEIGEAPLLDGGPTEKGGFRKAMIDKRNKKKGKQNLYNIDKLSEDEESTKETKKIAKESINNFMRKKSYFDRLYENAMNAGGPLGGTPPGGGAGGPPSDEPEDGELDALGVDDEMGEGDMEEGEGDVTFTLDRDTAQKLIDVLQAALGDEMEDLEGEGDMEGDDEFGDDLDEKDAFGDEDEEGFFDEDEEELGTPVSSPKEVNYGKNNKVGNLKVQSGSASSAYTNKVGADGDHGHAISSGKQPNMGKNNKVGSLKTGKSMFEQ